MGFAEVLGKLLNIVLRGLCHFFDLAPQTEIVLIRRELSQ